MSVSYVFTQLSLVCARMWRTPGNARMDVPSGSPWAASLPHISFGHLIVWEREEYIYNYRRVELQPFTLHLSLSA